MLQFELLQLEFSRLEMSWIWLEHETMTYCDLLYLRE